MRSRPSAWVYVSVSTLGWYAQLSVRHANVNSSDIQQVQLANRQLCACVIITSNAGVPLACLGPFHLKKGGKNVGLNMTAHSTPQPLPSHFSIPLPSNPIILPPWSRAILITTLLQQCPPKNQTQKHTRTARHRNQFDADFDIFSHSQKSLVWRTIPSCSYLTVITNTQLHFSHRLVPKQHPADLLGEEECYRTVSWIYISLIQVGN